jgi:chemotaxis protein MotA
VIALESDVEEPDKSPIFSKNPFFLKDHHVRDFICATVPIAALSTMADSLPGLGIVAAVLGVVITMGSLGGPPEEIGHKVAAALVGTFLSVMGWWGRWPRAWRRRQTRNMLSIMCCALSCWPS